MNFLMIVIFVLMDIIQMNEIIRIKPVNFVHQIVKYNYN